MEEKGKVNGIERAEVTVSPITRFFGTGKEWEEVGKEEREKEVGLIYPLAAAMKVKSTNSFP